MPAADTLASLQNTVNRTKGVMSSALTLITGIRDRIQTAVDAAIANGATEEQLAPLTQEIADLEGADDALAAAVAANP